MKLQFPLGKNTIYKINKKVFAVFSHFSDQNRRSAPLPAVLDGDTVTGRAELAGSESKCI